LSRELTAWQVLCLRLAVIECHARGEVDASGLTLTRAPSGGAHLTFSAQWAEEHPRTAYLLREEADLWARQGALLLTLN
jgi:exopolyphosphatase / guanosine-5'-triphosphate,3'-diphosphate pyrophosphatase